MGEWTYVELDDLRRRMAAVIEHVRFVHHALAETHSPLSLGIEAAVEVAAEAERQAAIEAYAVGVANGAHDQHDRERGLELGG